MSISSDGAVPVHYKTYPGNRTDDSTHIETWNIIVNNARFLILPWVTSHNLASRLLSMVIKRFPYDWYDRYKYKPVLLESFVDQEKLPATKHLTVFMLARQKVLEKYIGEEK